MSVRRVVPDVHTTDPDTSSAFYGLLGFEEVMNHGCDCPAVRAGAGP
jgi:hypothetical protein